MFHQLEKGRAYLETAPCGASLRDAAAHSGLSAFHFARLFHETFGETPATFHRRTLMERAKALLIHASVSEAGEDVGFQSTSSFVRAFRIATGTTPGAYKKTLGQNDRGLVEEVDVKAGKNFA